MSGVMAPTYQSGFAAPQRGRMKYPSLWRGCVGAWNPSLGQSGLVLRDWSSLGNNGVLTNGPTWGVSGGQQALSFVAASSQYVACTGNLLASATAGSISYWCRKTSSGSDMAVGSRLAATNGYWLQWYSDSILYLTVRNGGFSTASTSLPYTTDWVHLCGVWNAGSGEIFINGKSANTGATQTLSTNAGSALWIGGLSPSGFYADGKISDVMIHNGRLSPSQIRLLATRPGIAYELAPRRRSSIQVPGFKAAWLNQRSQIIGGGVK